MSGPHSEQGRTWRYIAAFVVFMGLLAVGDFLRFFSGPSSPWWLAQPEQWILPLQTVVCGWVLWFYRADYRLRLPKRWLETTGIGLLVFLLWIAPQAFFGAPPRTDGYEVGALTSDLWLQGTLLLLRFIRLVIVVPILEELFWRGFLLRYFVNDQFWKVAPGRTNAIGFLVVTILFALAHSEADRPAALATGVLYNWLYLRSRSVSSCILAHALTNLLLGIYIVATRQWGFW